MRLLAWRRKPSGLPSSSKGGSIMVQTVATRAAILAGAIVFAWALNGWDNTALAQQTTLRFHTFVPPVSSSYKNYVGWLKSIEQKSGDRLKIEAYGSMQLRGKTADPSHI